MISAQLDDAGGGVGNRRESQAARIWFIWVILPRAGLNGYALSAFFFGRNRTRPRAMQVGLRNRLHRNSVDAGRRRGAGSAFRLVYDGVAVPPALCRACPGSSSQARLEIQLTLLWSWSIQRPRISVSYVIWSAREI